MPVTRSADRPDDGSRRRAVDAVDNIICSVTEEIITELVQFGRQAPSAERMIVWSAVAHLRQRFQEGA